MKSYLRLLSVPVLLLGLAAPALAQQHEHDAHDEHATASAKNAKTADGKKWTTDAPLRKSMDAIRNIVQTNLPKVHSGDPTDAEFAAIGKQIDAEIAIIFKECKLAPEADAALHDILLPIMEGSKTLQEGTFRTLAFVKILKNVNSYGEQFDHPGFKPVKH